MSTKVEVLAWIVVLAEIVARIALRTSGNAASPVLVSLVGTAIVVRAKTIF